MISRILRRHSAVLLSAGVILAALLAASVTAPPADARPAPPGSTMILSVNGCDFTLTYEWHGFSGRLTGEVRLVEDTGTPIDIGIAYFSQGPVSGKSGTIQHTFHLTPNTHAARNIYARGSLFKGGTEVSGSRSDSSTTFGSTCGEPIT
jgi:hypothetical protein